MQRTHRINGMNANGEVVGVSGGYRGFGAFRGFIERFGTRVKCW